MNSIRASLMACAALAAMTSAQAHAAVDQYTAEPNARITLNLELCSAETQLAVRGDTGTDLDFTITDAAGSLIHTDEGIDDYLSLVIAKESEGCETYLLGVSNLGEEGNDFTVVIEPITESSARVQKYIVQGGETQKFPFKACGTSAVVSARGDGDTDLDFIIRNADGAVVHENADTTDETRAELEGLLSNCETFEMEVANLGEVYNALMVVIEPRGAPQTAYAGTPPSSSLAQASVALDDRGRVVTEAETSGAGEYRAEAKASLRVNLPVCVVTRLEVRGDGDTDLDFTVNDAKGNVVHSDFDLSDVTFTTLDPGDACETFAIEVDNLGDVHNDFSIALIDAESRGGAAGPGEYRVNASGATKVALRVCAITKVSVRGDGDTDLDFDVTDSKGESVHSDYDLTDRTEFTLDPGDTCADYQMAVENLGDVFNLLTVVFEDGNGPYVARIQGPKSAIAPPGPPIGYVRPSPRAGGAQGPTTRERSVAILNRTGEALSEIYWANSATLEWGADRLAGAYALSRGQQWNVDVADGSTACLFDFRAVTASGRAVEVTRVNVCEAGYVNIE